MDTETIGDATGMSLLHHQCDGIMFNIFITGDMMPYVFLQGGK
jgi:hypothetical protein